MDVEGCHRLALSNAYKTQNPAQDKGFIVKSVNIKYSECLLQLKKVISSRNYSHLDICKKPFVTISLCPYYQQRLLLGKCA